uniref:Carbohydrate esterase n=2 Tax=Kalmanozyma brasiliensis (strain GHG001) TaxID=1365824 RepID=V5EJW9_KALBG
MSMLLWCALALQLGAQLALGRSIAFPPTDDEWLRRQSSTSSLPSIPACIPPQGTSPLGIYPPSAVTTKQTGTNCNRYGDPPARVLNNVQSPNGLQDYVQICHGQIITMTDKNGQERAVCFYANPKSTKDKPLPLLVYLHPSLFGSTVTFPLTGIDEVRDIQSLNNEDPSRLGFSYILPAGRNTIHQYPFPDDTGLGWDNWYRNVDRRSRDLNIDVDFIDKTIAYAKGHVPVDKRRVFMTGWSNGAAMTELYAANTDGIASAAVYSAPDPYRDSQDPCTQVPYPKYATPVRDIHNYCDIIGICTTGKYYRDDLKRRYPSLPQSLVVIDVVTTAVMGTDDGAKCDPACQGACAVTTGSVAHNRWPAARNSDTFFSFLRANPLPKSGFWGAPK